MICSSDNDVITCPGCIIIDTLHCSGRTICYCRGIMQRDFLQTCNITRYIYHTKHPALGCPVSMHEKVDRRACYALVTTSPLRGLPTSSPERNNHQRRTVIVPCHRNHPFTVSQSLLIVWH
jgi:hypothetical protein